MAEPWPFTPLRQTADRQPENGNARARLRRTPIVLAAMLVAICALASTALEGRHPRLVWNATASSPVGLYWIAPARTVRPGEWVVAWAPRSARELGAVRRYLPRNVPLVKRVAAAAGNRVCASAGGVITIDGRTVARRRKSDDSGRPLPRWTGCELLRGADLFLLSPDQSRAFDGRYFGVTRAALVVGRARLLWAR
ncbi:MAG TPA: S26 family signal peptidase [Croceibacterium sp.]|nr:S26 family signal peptidase [Croceibacterium sp.]